MILDLDRFKPINDTFGHQAGDAVLKAVAEVLRTATRESDAVGRLGGDEFVVLVNHANLAGARVCASNLLSRISNLAVPFEGQFLTVGVSIGLAPVSSGTMTTDKVLSAADAALYESKRRGRNQLSCAS